jgi:UDP-N-acetyl-D-glucosamine/UDP-N-acetyl-D-galactosamine dehydrogenase
MLSALEKKQSKLAVVGLGYVGLPLAIEFAKKFSVIGFDISNKKISELRNNIDTTNELTSAELKATKMEFTTNPAKLKEASFIVVAVPTPIDNAKKPDLTPVIKASETVGKNLAKGSIIVYESTVYPGVTEEICVPILEKESDLKCGPDFKVGYSPERINPGDKEHSVTTILKIVSGQDQSSLKDIADVYGSIIKAGIYQASSIKVAEAAKVIENTQRDLNIALMNELAIIFNKLGINTQEVIAAAATKWNFIKMSPGLVGGHCIGVDPYYLTYKAEMIGYHPQVILAGRKINDSMGKYIAEQTVKHLIKAGKAVKDSEVVIMGFTFKENVPDIRNTRVVDVVRELAEYGIHVSIFDPYADQEEIKKEYGLSLTSESDLPLADALIVAVAHDAFKKMNLSDLKTKMVPSNQPNVLIDIKGLYRHNSQIKKEFLYWEL